MSWLEKAADSGNEVGMLDGAITVGNPILIFRCACASLATVGWGRNSKSDDCS